MSGIFDGIENAKASFASNYVRAGSYEADLGKVELTKNHAKVEFLAIEMTVTKVMDNDEGRGHKVGDEITHLMKVQNTSFLGNFKQFAASALNCDADQVGKAEADRITSDEQPLVGVKVGFVARQTTTKAGGPFTKVIYSSIEEGA
jgi:hypothetical protein